MSKRYDWTKPTGIVGIKADKGKRDWSFLRIIAQPLGEVMDILQLGDVKYPSETNDNWKRVPDAKRRYTAALGRHIIDGWMQGETHDKETGKHHLAHAISNCLFLLWFELNSYPDDKENK